MNIRLAVVAALLLGILTAPACEPVPIGGDRTDGGGAVPIACSQTSQCSTFIDYCVNPCGVCRAAAAAIGSTCEPPPIGKCLDACENTRAACVAGLCTVR